MVEDFNRPKGSGPWDDLRGLSLSQFSFVLDTCLRDHQLLCGEMLHVLAHVAHEQHGPITREQRGIADVGDWDGELESTLRGVPEVTLDVVEEVDTLVTRQHGLDGPRLVGGVGVVDKRVHNVVRWLS